MKRLLFLTILLVAGSQAYSQCNASFLATVNNNAVSFTNNSTISGGANYFWDFGNGTTSYSFSPTAYYTSVGTYQVCLYLQDSTNNCVDTSCQMVTITSIPACQANMSLSITGTSITGLNSSSGGGSNEWHVLDSNMVLIHTSSSSSLSYNPAFNGSFTVCLILYDFGGNFCDSVCNSIIFNNAPVNCSAYFAYNDSGYGQILFYANNVSTYTYSWNFGDMTFGTGSYPFHTYSAPGTYYPCLTITDSSNGCTDTYCDTVVVNIPNCAAAFSAYQSGNSIYGFNNSTGASSVQWIVSDASGNLLTTSTNNNLVFTPGTSGTYNICLALFNSLGAFCDSTCDFVNFTIPNTSCNASFTWADTGLVTTFNNNSTASSNVTYFWMFGDGSTSSFTNPVHTYSTAGTYPVCLIVFDSTCTDSICTLITVGSNNLCSAGYVWYLDTTFAGSQPNTVYLFDISTGASLSYLWDFGDGTTSTLQYPSHTYAQNGSYSVCVTISDNSGCTDTYCDTVTYTVRAEGFTINVLPYSAIGSVDIEDKESIQLMQLYPNPANDILTIEIEAIDQEDVLMIITDLSGRVAYSENLMIESGKTNQILDVSSLTKGAYFLILNAQQGRTVHRFVIQ